MISSSLNTNNVQFQLNSTFSCLAKLYSNFHYWQESVHYFHQFGSESFEKSYSDKLIDEDEINSLVQTLKLLKHKFFVVFAADIFLP